MGPRSSGLESSAGSRNPTLYNTVGIHHFLAQPTELHAGSCQELQSKSVRALFSSAGDGLQSSLEVLSVDPLQLGSSHGQDDGCYSRVQEAHHTAKDVGSPGVLQLAAQGCLQLCLGGCRGEVDEECWEAHVAEEEYEADKTDCSCHLPSHFAFSLLVLVSVLYI